MNQRQADVIAAEIDYTTDILRATNDLLEARANHRKAQESGDIHKVIAAQVKVIHAERALAELYPAELEPPMPELHEPEHCGETFPKRQRSAGMHPDDPRKGQAESINRQNRSI